MSQTAKNQIDDILARERRRLGLDNITEEDQLYKKCEQIARSIVKQGREIFLANPNAHDREKMKAFLQKQFHHRFVEELKPHEMAFLLSVMHAEETINAVEGV